MKSSKVMSFVRRAEVVAANSPDADTKVGTVLISNKTGSVISEGYNGFVRGGSDEALPKTRPDKYDFMIHAETNLICNAARNGVTTDDCVVVQTHSPCVNCARLLHQAGIKTVYFRNYHESTDKVSELRDLNLKFTVYEGYTRIDIEPMRITE